MNWQHLSAFCWLRWRLAVNQARRGGQLNAVVTIVVIAAAVTMMPPLAVASFVAGLLLTPAASATLLLWVGDGLVLAFLFFWAIGLLTELQRTETLSVDRFLHLPVSLRGVFAINYLSSLARLSVLVFAPLMLGLVLALPFTKGPRLLLALPLVAALLLMITALSYQFQGWLASLMNNPRRRRTVTVMSVFLFVMLCQLPQLFNVYRPWQRPASEVAAQEQELARLNESLAADEISGDTYREKSQEIEARHAAEKDARQRRMIQNWQNWGLWLNQIVPLGWLPLGVMTLAEGRLLPALLALSGMTLVGSASLWRAYRTTLRLYQGSYTASPARVARTASGAASSRRTLLVEWRLPLLSEQATAVALAGYRALLRAPEAKMMLLTPLLMGGIFGTMLVGNAAVIPEMVRPLMALGSMLLVLFGLLQIMGNQFGFDRDGFRTLVLSAADRRDILLGKNLSFAPFAFGLLGLLLLIGQIFLPLKLWQLLAAPLQFLSMYLLFCLLVNLFSIYTPMRIAPGTLKPSSPKLLTMLVQLTLFSLLFPLTTLPAVLPLAVDAALTWDGRIAGAPVNLLLSLVLTLVVVLAYRAALVWQGQTLRNREQQMLEIITSRAA